MIFSDSGMVAEQELRSTIWLMGEVGRRRDRGEAGNPVAPSDSGVFTQREAIEVDGHCEGIDAGSASHP